MFREGGETSIATLILEMGFLLVMVMVGAEAFVKAERPLSYLWRDQPLKGPFTTRDSVEEEAAPNAPRDGRGKDP